MISFSRPTRCRSLNQLLTSGTLEKGRKLKVSVGDRLL